jgi:enoyl-CoA hydratase/carnithine racemase
MSPATGDPVELTLEPPLAFVSLNRPEVLNAVDTPLIERLGSVFGELSDAPGIRCVVLRGNGRAFCVGADQKERPGMSADEVRRRRRIAPAAFSAMSNCVRPVIGQVHGYALGSGLELALGCDIVVAAEGTEMGLIETRLGAIPGGGGTQLLPRLVGMARAKELIFTGRRFTAADAARWGMISYAVPEADLAATVLGLAEEISAAAPIAVAQAKQAITMSSDLDLANGLRLEAALSDRTLTTEDRAEALQAYRERRPPVFRGR